MTIKDIITAVGGEMLTTTPIDGVDAKGCYVCDLLSLAMSKVSAGDVWITVQANVNIAAVAVLTEAACVLIAEGMNIEDSVIAKANNEGVIIIRTEKNAFECAMAIGKSL
ncbi:MAG: AraC family transcriptional regulator [Clostridia bacterium]|nr:AraC family transcriptional regulator [Clostridia bacterium]